MHANQISNSGSQEAIQYQAIAHSERRVHSLEAMQKIVLNDIQQGDPQTSSAFADYCAENLSGEITMALCLARINQDSGLQMQALAELSAHVDKCHQGFSAQEVERRIAAAQVANVAMLERAYV
ncbi:hypothetical protein [Pseudomonas leptonychotis]|uniref:hypothetical protein n=1 Tax=Pseudomonas leptonychotis TaxID=2448482 RepID=UPI00386C68D1